MGPLPILWGFQVILRAFVVFQEEARPPLPAVGSVMLPAGIPLPDPDRCLRAQ